MQVIDSTTKCDNLGHFILDAFKQVEIVPTTPHALLKKLDNQRTKLVLAQCDPFLTENVKLPHPASISTIKGDIIANS